MTTENKELVNEYVREIGVTGSRNALNNLYEIVREPLYKILYAYYNNHHDIEDIIEKVLDVVIDKASGLITYKNCYNWIIKIGKNLINNMLRKEKRRKELLYSMPIPAYAEVNESKVMMIIELKKLTNEEQRLIFYKFYCKFKIDEISLIMGISKATVHRKLAELYDSLKEKLEWRI